MASRRRRMVTGELDVLDDYKTFRLRNNEKQVQLISLNQNLDFPAIHGYENGRSRSSNTAL